MVTILPSHEYDVQDDIVLPLCIKSRYGLIKSVRGIEDFIPSLIHVGLGFVSVFSDLFVLFFFVSLRCFCYFPRILGSENS